MTAEKQARAERPGLIHLVILALTRSLAGYTNRPRRQVHFAPGQGKQLSRLAVFCHHGLIRDGRHFTGFVGRPPIASFIGATPGRFQGPAYRDRKELRRPSVTFRRPADYGCLRLSHQHFSPLQISPQRLLASSRAASNSSIVSSPGHLFQTSFSQWGFNETTPASKSSRENAGFPDGVNSLFFVKIHLAPMPILLSSVEFSKVTGTDACLLLAQRFEHVAIVRLQLIAVQPHQTLPINALGNRRRLVERWPALLIRYLEKEQKRQLLRACAERVEA